VDDEGNYPKWFGKRRKRKAARKDRKWGIATTYNSTWSFLRKPHYQWYASERKRDQAFDQLLKNEPFVGLIKSRRIIEKVHSDDIRRKT